MPPLLALVLVVVSLAVAAVVAMLFVRRRRVREAARRAQAPAVPELNQSDIAWRIGVTGAARPTLLSDWAATIKEEAEREATAASAAFVAPLATVDGPPQVADEPADLLPVEPAEPEPIPAAPLPFMTLAPMPAPPELAPAAYLSRPVGRASTFGAAADLAAAVTPVAATAPAPRLRDKPARRGSGRLRLWRDAAAVLLVVCLVALAATSFLPGMSIGPAPTPPDASAFALAVSPAASMSPDGSSSSTDPSAPGDAPGATSTPRPRPTARPTHRTTTRSTPRATPRPTPKPTPRPTPKPTPRSTPTPPPPFAIAVCHASSFTVTCDSSASINVGKGATYTWEFEVLPKNVKKTGKTASYTYPSDAAGTYTVKLTIRNPNGAKSSDTTSVTVTS